jgi:soluble P-type ATPase
MRKGSRGNMNNTKRSKWTLAFYDMASADFTKRARVTRELKKQGAAMHSQSVYCVPYTANSFQQLKAIDKSICVVKADVPDESIEELTSAYDAFVEKLFIEIKKKIEELEDAKVSVMDGDPSSKRGYSKRMNKMYERLDYLSYVASLREKLNKNEAKKLMAQVEEIKTHVRLIDYAPPGTLIDWENALVREINKKETE